MKQLASQSNVAISFEEDTATLIMQVIPLVKQVFRKEMRKNRPADLSVPQFRALIFINKHADVSISDVAEHLGLALSTTSKLIDGLMSRQYIKRETAAADRRRAVVTLTELGASELNRARRHAQQQISEHMAKLSPEENQLVITALHLIERVFRQE